MIIYYNAQDRKPLVKAISEFTGEKAVYMRTPTYAYRIDYFTVTREGNLEFDDRADSEEIEKLIEFLSERGFVSEDSDTAANTAQELTSEELSAAADNAAHGAPAGLTVEIPLESAAVGNLTKLLDAKGGLIRRALAVEDIRIEVTDSTVKFPWFAECGADECKAYTHFISALCELAKNAKRVTAKEKATDNDKYAFRCFLLRLGFIGSEYKAERKILLRTLTGSSASEMEVLQMKFPSKETIEQYRREYPVGCRVELISMDDLQAPPKGTRGTVRGVDDAGNLLVRWDNGSGLNAVLGVDVVRKIHG